MAGRDPDAPRSNQVQDPRPTGLSDLTPTLTPVGRKDPGADIWGTV
ncbi:hypothetical protein J2S58_002681 [Nakamurella flavida]|nr:hypothetical protein [Nakamurella flavida]